MNGFTFAPALGWLAAGCVAALLLAFAVAEVVVHVRRHGATDETVAACVRRTLTCLLAAVMVLTPATVSTTTSRAIRGTDVMVAVDVTGSMAVKDAEYGSQTAISRLDAAKRIVQDVTAAYPDSSYAALRFGASGTLDLPLTPDSSAVQTWADALAPEATTTSAGSSLDTPLDQLMLSLKSIRDQHPDDTVILYLITDGEQTSTTTRRSYSVLRRYVDDAFAIGVGSAKGGNVPDLSGGTQSDGTESWVIDPTTGKPGVSKLDEQTLKAIADEMGGAYLHADATHTVAQAVSSKASGQWRLAETPKRRTRTIPLVWPFATATLLLLTWELGAWIATSRRML
ncbi:vWA domain-containing protein [Bifidobacterium leontopitheci]|uniref:VWA domain-containing protein n=1 Tax=Bifidobacterium leontopitheci TaxID=2650774 RepID=A0A6I1GPU6_9BIFI|nr:vWA domain-containing protein [Bifidobacterium leontopitheci]KAB7791409.1 VWA domain-containing protein [Bifidobacterium leontopitheci]